MVVQHVDAEEEQDIDEPAAKRDDIRSHEEGRPCPVELRNVTSDGDEQELNKGDERSCVDKRMVGIDRLWERACECRYTVGGLEAMGGCS